MKRYGSLLMLASSPLPVVVLAIWILAPLIIVLTASFTSSSIPAANKAQIWMMASALLGWCLFSIALWIACKRFGLFGSQINSKYLRVGVFVTFSGFLAMIEEMFTQFMTNNAPLFGVPLGQAYITPSLDYWDTVSHHSVVVFLPMFAVCALCSERWKFKPKEIFFLVGSTGLLAEMTMNPASLFMGFWLLIYGFMVLLPAVWLYRGTEEPSLRRWWHYPLSIALMLCAGAVGSLALHGVFPKHPDNHFARRL